MEHRRKIQYILLCGVMAALLSVACSKSSSDTQEDEELTWYELIYFNITRSDVDLTALEDRTYNFTLFGGTSGNTCYSGTYRVPEDGENTSILYPCQCNANTGAVEDGGEFDSSFGLTAPAANYQIVVASPAVAVSSITDHTDIERKGFKIARHIDDNSTSEIDLFIKGPRTVSVSGVEIGGQKEYISSELDLSRPRSKFVLYIRSDDAEESYYVYDVHLDNVLQTGYYNPTVGYYRGSNDVGTITPYSNFVSSDNPLKAISTLTLMEVSSSYKTTIEASDDYDAIEHAFYLLANDCSEGESTYVAVPNLVITLNRDGDNDEDNASVVTIPLEYNFNRSCFYEFTITISPIGITLSGIEVDYWNSVNGGDITVENLSPINFEYAAAGDWEEGSDETVTFGE